MQSEGIDNFLKRGEFLHGEWLTSGQRCPCGGHSGGLPEGLTERERQPPDFPEYEHKLEATDGCATQFAGKNNYHQTATWKVSTTVFAALAVR